MNAAYTLFLKTTLRHINKAMEAREQNLNCRVSTSPDVFPAEHHEAIPTHSTRRLADAIPNRIFVGGIDYEVNESELLHIFSQHGAIKDVRIVIDRFGLSKGYGFVTFENEEDVQRILQDANGVTLKDKRLYIGQAFCRQGNKRPRKRDRRLDSAAFLPMFCSTVQQASFPQNIAFPLWPSLNHPLNLMPLAVPSVMFPQPYRPAFQHFACHQYQCVQDQRQLNVIQSPVMHSYTWHRGAESHGSTNRHQSGAKCRDLVQQECHSP